jgi:hypothetical protein
MQKITTKITWDWTGNVIEHEFYDYHGTVDLCKGDNTLRAQEQQQAAFNTQLQSAFSAQFAQQNGVLQFLQDRLKPMLDHPTGFSSEAMTALRTQASDNLSNTYQNARAAQQQQAFTLGGRDLPSGVNDQIQGALFQAEAADKANAQNNITLQDEQLKQQNYWNAMGVLSGNVVNAINPLGYAGTANEGGNTVANLGQAYNASRQSQLLGALGGIASGVGAAFTGSGTKALFGKG